MSLSEIIIQTEKKWLHLLSLECKRIFKNHHIPSHDYEHHKRVWGNAKVFFSNISDFGSVINEQTIESLIIACFFHDTGLTITIDEKHGRASKDLCQSYFNLNPTIRPNNLNEILHIIEFHENKDYSGESTDPFSLLSLLSAADDCDAFGFTGIYRYAEIYLIRNILPQDLAEKVLVNLENRFNNIRNKYQNMPQLFMQLERKFLITRNFYVKLKNEYNENSFVEAYPIINIIQKQIVENRKSPEYVWIEMLGQANNEYVIEFMNNIIAENNGI